MLSVDYHQWLKNSEKNKAWKAEIPWWIWKRLLLEELYFQKYTAGNYCPLGPAFKWDNTLRLKESRKTKYGGMWFFLSNTVHILIDKRNFYIILWSSWVFFMTMDCVCNLFVPACTCKFVRLYLLKIIINTLDH